MQAPVRPPVRTPMLVTYKIVFVDDAKGKKRNIASGGRRDGPDVHLLRQPPRTQQIRTFNITSAVTKIIPDN